MRARRHEIEQALLARTSTMHDPLPSDDPEYREGFRAAVSAGFVYSLSVIESGEGEDPPPVPAQILTQARLAARHSVGLDTVLRRYVGGSTLLDDFILDEIDGESPQSVLRARAAALELLLQKVVEEYSREMERRRRSRKDRDLARVEALLEGDHSQIGQLNYEMKQNHVGLVACGPDVTNFARGVRQELDSDLLLVWANKETAWVWLGRRGSIRAEDIQHAVATGGRGATSIAFGETAHGVTGWRYTHRQAKAALKVAVRSSAKVARYADVCLQAAAIDDDLLAGTLHKLYLQPLMTGRDGGVGHIQTLQAYFNCQQNAASTASKLGVSRQTVANRLRAIEGRLGRSLASCSAEIALALSLETSRIQNASNI